MARVLLVTEDGGLAEELKGLLAELGHALAGVVPRDGALLESVRNGSAEVLLYDAARENGAHPLEMPGVPVLILNDGAAADPDRPNPYRLAKPPDRLELKYKLECAAYDGTQAPVTPPPFRWDSEADLPGEWFRTLYEYAPDAYFVMDLSGVFVDGNLAAEELTGYKREELIGRSFVKAKLFHVGQFPKAARLLQKIRRGSRTGPDELVLTRKSGEQVPIEVRTYPIRTNGRRLVLGIARDISKHKQAEEGLRASEARFRSMFELSPESITLLDRSGRVITTNAKVHEWLGFKLEEVIGRKLSSLPILTKTGLARVLQQFRRRIKGQDVPPYEVEFVHKDGRKFFGRITANPIQDENGEVSSVLVLISDVTAERRAGEELRTSRDMLDRILNGMHDAVAVIAPDHRIREVNDSFFRIYGGSREDVLGKTCHEVTHRLDKPCPEECHLEKVFKSGRPKTYVHVHKNAHGGEVSVEVSLFPLQNPQGKVEAVVEMEHDITEQRRIAEALREERDRAQTYLDIAGVIILALDARGRVTLINQKGCEVLGRPEGEILGKSWVENFVPDWTRERVEYTFERLMAGEVDPLRYVEYYVLTSDGRMRLIAWNNTIFTDDTGDIVGTLSSGEDITDRRLAETALRESEEKYRNLVERANDGIVIVQDEVLRYVNPRMTELVGYRNEEMLGTPFGDYLTPEEREESIEIYKHRMAGKNVPSVNETILRHKSGKKVRVEANGGLIIYEGKPADLVFLHDITQHKEAENALRESEAKLKATLDALPDLLFEVDLRGKIYDFRTPDSSTLYVSPEHFLGKTVEEVIPPDAARVIMDTLARAAQTGSHRGAVYGLDMPDGPRWFELSIAAKGDPKAPEGRLIVTSRDVTERKKAEEALRQSEEKYRFLFEGSTTLNLIIALDGTLIDSNITALEEFGYTREEVRGRNALEFVVEKDRDLIAGLLEKSYRGEDTPEIDAGIIAKDGSVRTCLFSRGNVVLTVGDRPVSIVVTGIDITERKKAEEMMKKALREKEVLLKEIHHRVKNNLQIISSLLNLEAGKTQDELVQGIISTSQNRIKSMALIHEKLYQSKELSRVDFPGYIKSLLDSLLVTYTNGSRFITPQLDLSPLYLDISTAIPLALVINELVSNSLEHAFPNGRKGVISIALNADGNGNYTLCVADDGVGIADGLDLENTKTLGLQLVNMLTQQIGATVEVVKTSGTEFRITFSEKKPQPAHEA
jgi:PAS domain S-box-containing protein